MRIVIVSPLTAGVRSHAVFDLIVAYAAGLLTLLNPCVLPLLPLIAAGSVARHPLGPLAMAGGLAISFTLAGISIFAITRATGLAQEDITVAAGWIMVGFGVEIGRASCRERV